MNAELTKRQAAIVLELLVANAISAEYKQDVVDLIIKCQRVVDETEEKDGKTKN